jgi:hypothetical protein
MRPEIMVGNRLDARNLTAGKQRMGGAAERDLL